MAEEMGLLERAQLLQKAKQIQAQKQSENGNGQPGAAAMGFPDGPTTAEEESPGIIGRAKQGLSATAKLLDAPRAATGGPALALALKALTGKDAASLSEFGNGLNPTNLEKFPNSAEMYKRVGVPEGAKMSDYVPGYSQPGSPWYRPEKGGKLDFTVRGAGGLGSDIATDPLTYVSLGAATAAKKALAESATRNALEQAAKETASPASKALSMVGDTATNAASKIPGVAQIGQGSEALNNALSQNLPGLGVQSLATAPSDILKKLGKKIYNAPVTAVEHEGAKFGKNEVGETLYQAGIKSPIGLRQNGEQAIKALGNARDKIFDQAADQGAVMNMDRALQGAKETAAEIRQAGVPGEQHIADELEAQIAAHQKMVQGVPAVPAKTTLQPSGTLNWKGEPVMQEVTTPGVEAIEGRQLPPKMSSRIKTSIGQGAPNSTWSELLKTPQGAKATLPLYSGFRKEAQLSTAEKLGPKAGQDIAELDDSMGKLLSTKKSQTAVQNLNERIENNAHSLTGTDSAIAGLAAHGERPIEQSAFALALKKALDTYRVNQMRLGYGLRKAGEGQMTAPAIDVYARRKFIKANEPGGPQDGEE